MTREEFIDLVREEQVSLRRFLLALCGGDSDMADDLAQESLIRAYVASDSFRGLSKFSTWLYRIAYNCFVDKCRRKAPEKVNLDAPAVGNIPSSASSDASFRYQQLYMALEKLQEKERACIVLFYFEDLPVKEITKILHMASGTVRYTLTMARRHLKDYITL
ncbi:MAG: RNA polymerase sigma factor [Bacteroidales bacterium]|nr:RNA polymerase sigma factor [Bacteroidales bacterium]